MPRVDHLGFADGRQHALRGRRIRQGFPLAEVEVFLDRHLFLARLLVSREEIADDVHEASFV